jgi:hypothetical protein
MALLEARPRQGARARAHLRELRAPFHSRAEVNITYRHGAVHSQRGTALSAVAKCEFYAPVRSWRPIHLNSMCVFQCADGCPGAPSSSDIQEVPKKKMFE